MRNRNLTQMVLTSAFALTVCLGVICMSASAGMPRNQDEPPKEEKKLTIKDIMDQAHKKGLIKKVATGKASEAETKKLQTLYTALSKLSAPQGDKKSWEEKTKALVVAAKAAVDKDVDYATKLKAASNCTACHKIHKP